MKTPISPVSILGGSSESCRAATQFLNRFVLLAMLLLLAGFCLPAQTPPGEWVWMGGSSAPNQPAVYGTLGTPAPDNTPGARAGALSWTDGNGNLWLFGGVGSELWEFNPSTNEWAWMGGSSFTSQMPVYGTMGTPAPGNTPGAASGGYSTWRDGSGHFWLFGGGYYDPGVNENIAVNALWEFDPSSNEWAWMGGSSTIGSCLPPDPWNITCGHAGVYGALGTPAAGNIPGSRSGASTWTDSKGNFWLFGGGGFDSTGNGGELNDLWVFNPSTNQWTWRGGSSTVNQVGVYGTLGTPAPDNIPGPRSSAVTWEDGSGHFWLYAGVGLADSRGFPTVFDDLWEFNPSLNEWAWMGGSNTNPSCSSYCPLYGEYGTLGSPAAGNIPGERSSAASWTDSNGNLWLLGGSAASEKATSIDLNDIWEFNPSLNEWAWMDGSHPYTGGDPNACKNHYPRAIVCAGSYGTFGIPSAGNLAPGRDSASIWTDSDGHLWLFGGNGCIWPGSDYDPTCGQFNDLWEYLPDGAPTPATPTFSLSSGTYTSPQTVSISDSTPGAVIYYTLDDSTPKASSARYSAPLTISNAGTVIKAYAGELGYHNTEVTNIKYWIRPAAPTFSLPSGQYLTPQPLTISNTFAGATIYYTTDGSRPSASST
ncbi:MAG TPA: chitobiase/beta-hexosaminidase C-terminal domain-containing protein, partial [Terracidiphilus sp.]|nr:chitobiase/beta-hexosaminidase C-terminal domain-containing protein [Terracidiphilus sp.]